MRAILALAFAIPISIYSQTISGIVVDVDGKAIVGVRIDHSTWRYGEIVSDSTGRFSTNAEGAAVVFRKPGYRSQWVQTPGLDLRVVLQIELRKPFPTCKSLRDYEGMANGRSGLYFLMTGGVSPIGNGSDIDYSTRTYAPRNSRRGIYHGKGPMWSFGLPVSKDIWESVEYAEASYSVPGIDSPDVAIRDCRGKTASGKLWRFVGMLGESATYHDADEATARILDRVMDGACWLPGK